MQSPFRRILVPLDLSALSLDALDWARELADALTEIHVVHVLAPLSAADPGVIWGQVDDDERRRHARATIEAQLPEASAAIQLAVFIGDPGHEIVDHAQRIEADLILMPSHGRTGARRMVLGSVAERVVRLASCPVLVLKQTEIASLPQST